MSNFSLRTPSDRTNFANLVKAQFAKKGDKLTCAGIAEAIGATTIQVRNVLNDLVESGVLIAEGNTRARTYTLAVSVSSLAKAA